MTLLSELTSPPERVLWRECGGCGADLFTDDDCYEVADGRTTVHVCHADYECLVALMEANGLLRRPWDDAE